MSLLWIWYTCNILVSLLKDIADLIQIPNSFMGMTILTYGNSIPDLLLNMRLNIPINRITVRDVILNIDDISKISGFGVKKLAIIFDTFESLNLDIRRWKMTISISKLKEINYYRKTI